MIKKITTSIVLIYSMLSFAQQSTSSPYSYFGIGETKFRGTPEQKAMGGLGILPDSTHINLLNPASYSSLWLTTISLSGGTSFNKQTTNQESSTSQRSSLDHLAIGIPMGDFGVGFGLNPQTSVGYKIQSITSDATVANMFTGEGGSNRVFVGGAYKVTPNLSFGVDASYYFGEINTIGRVSTLGTQYSTRHNNTIRINGLGFNIGMMYNTKIFEKYNLYTSATYSPESKLDFEKNSSIGTIGYSQNGTEYYDDYLLLDQENGNYTLPSKFSAGAGIGELRKWLIGTEVVFSGKNNALPLSGSSVEYDSENGMRFSLGGYYTPKYNSFTNYFQRVTYRAGLRYEKTGLVINDKSINDIGVSVGAGLPIGNGFSDLTFVFEYGKRGTKANNLVSENYFNITIGLSITDKWFRKFLYE